MKLNKLVTLLFLVVLTNQFSAQDNPLLEKGDKAFNDFDFDEALFFYDVANENTPDDASITRRLANTYRRMGRLNISAEWFRKTLELDASNPQDMILYAEALKSMQEYDEAIHWYEMFSKLQPTDSRALSHLRDKYYYKDLMADTSKYIIRSLMINNEFPVIGITEFENEKYLVSAVNLEPKTQKELKETLPYLDIYLCDINAEGELTNPVKLDKSVNSRYHDGPAFYSFIDHSLYITRTNMRGGKPVVDKNGNANLKIYSSRYDQNKWSNAQELKFNDDGFSNGYPGLSTDGQTMYFVSNRPGGFGGTDIYKSVKNANNWSDPINLGANINTPGDERFPYISQEGVLYFSSDGHAGLGGLDIFKSELLGGVWQTPVNMGSPVNTNHDDFNLIYDKENNFGFFCSNRNGNGNDDLFSFKQVLVSKMVLAGAIKSTLPGISFAGERVQIKNVSTGETTIVKLDESERFEYIAKPGEQIEMTMLNDEYFNTAESVIKYTVNPNQTDPFVNLGDSQVQLKKTPPFKGELSQTVNGGIKDYEASLKAEKPILLGENEEGIMVGKKTNNAQKEAEYQKKIKEADQLYKAGKLEQSRNAYISATAIKPNDPHALAQIKKAEEKIENNKKQNNLFDQLVLEGDDALESGKIEEAIQAYKSALKVKANDPYVKRQLARAGDELARAKKKENDFETLEAVIDLKALEIDNVIFDYNKALIRKEDMPTLEKVYKIMKENPDTKLLIRAHCDSRGSLAYNQSLSMSRAMAVQGYLMQRGIASSRFKSEWFGEQRPLNGCTDDIPCEEDQHEVNRRAEFKLVKLTK